MDGAEQQSRVYMTASWVQIAVRAVAQTAATIDFEVRKIGPGERTASIDNHPFEVLLRHPNPWYSRHELLEATFAYRLITGNAYWYLNRPSEDVAPAEIWVIPPHLIYPIVTGGEYVSGYQFVSPDGMELVIPPWQVVHFKNFNPLDPFVGCSPLEAVRYDIAGDLAMQRHNARIYGGEGLPPGILAFSDPINDIEFDQIQRDLHRDRDRAFVLRGVGAGGVQWLPITARYTDMQYLESRQFTKEEIFNLFAPGLASVLAINATEANAHAGRATFMDLAVRPAHVAVSEKITNDILPIYSSRRIEYVGQFKNVSEVDQELELRRIETASGVMTINEIRQQFFGLDELPDDRGNMLSRDRLQSQDYEDITLASLMLEEERRFDRGERGLDGTRRRA
jgi:HK97 family phage portal protein